MANVRELKATARERAGTGGARAERRKGRVPGIVYGDGREPMAISVDQAELRQRIYAGHFLTTICDLDVDGTRQRVIPRDYQLDPVKDFPIHVDFMRLGEGATIRVNIPVHVLNADASPGVKRGGAVNIVTHAIEVRCPADAIPASIDVDLTGLEIAHSIHLSELTLPPNVRPLVAEATLVTIVPPSGYLEEQRAAAAAAAAAGAPGAEGAPAEGAAPAAGAAAAGGASAGAGAEKK